jgi:hypothetical protein
MLGTQLTCFTVESTNTDTNTILARPARNNRAEAVLLRVCVYMYMCVYMLCICYVLADARYSIYLLY